MLPQLYRKFIPQNIRDKIYDAFLGQILSFGRSFDDNIKSKYIYLFRKILPDTERNRFYTFMGKYGVTAYPYPFMLEYKKLSIDCRFDNEYGMNYIVHFGKRLYFPKFMDRRTIIISYRNLLIEQDDRSPHQYVKNISRLKGKILLDIGAAEGIFTLNCIDILKYAYLFECDEEWIEAITVTFAPWKDKVTIVQKYVGDTNDNNNITIDRFLEDKAKDNLFLKMDIEGYEQAALHGSENILKNAQNIDFSICTYHKREDAVEIAAILRSYGFVYEYTAGVLYFEKEFRTAIIRSC